MYILFYVLISALVLGLGFLAGFFYRKYLIDSHVDSLEALGKKILDESGLSFHSASSMKEAAEKVVPLAQ